MVPNTSKSLTKKMSIKGPNNEDEEWENHLIIRFPNEIASKVDEIVSEDAPSVIIKLKKIFVNFF